jgi:regulatory protein
MMGGLQKKILTREQALQKLRHFCAYQERCHREVSEKLYQLGVRKYERDEIIASLIEENCLNEERFARQFAGGKFRIKHWGRIKIRQALKQKQVSDYCIRTALAELDEAIYRRTASRLGRTKWKSIRGTGVNHFVKMSKTRNYLLQKGYEPAIISDILKELGEMAG